MDLEDATGTTSSAAAQKKPREEQEWQLLYHFDPSQPISVKIDEEEEDEVPIRSSPLRRNTNTTKTIATVSTAVTTAITNDWRERLEFAQRMVSNAATSTPGTIGLPNGSSVVDPTSSSGPIVLVPAAVPGRRRRGRPRKYPIVAPERSRQVLQVSSRYARDLQLLSGIAVDGVDLYEHRRFLYNGLHPQNDEPTTIGCEYDMDEEGTFVEWKVFPPSNPPLVDFAWLSLPENGLSMIGQDSFEAIMEGLERGWHRLTRPLQRYAARCDEAAFPDDMACAVCGLIDTTSAADLDAGAGGANNASSTGNVANLMIICEGCDVAVHQDCYGVVHIPEGPWLCRRCLLSPSPPSSPLKGSPNTTTTTTSPQCALCPWPGGALKQTTETANPLRSWAHLVCARFLPNEALILNPVYLEPIDIRHVDPERWSLTCVYCRRKSVGGGGGGGRSGGAPVQCADRACRVAFHPLCARAVNARMDVADGWAFCWRHSNVGNPDASIAPTVRIPSREETLRPRKHARIRLLTHPRAPKALLTELAGSVLGGGLRRYGQVTAIARYWALKRASRRGLALLRSLQLEPWTTSATTAASGTAAESVSRLETGRVLLDQTASLKSLCEMVWRRERLKLGIVTRAIELIDLIIDPLSSIMRVCLNELYSFDEPLGFFRHPVDPVQVPDYYEIVQNPMWIDKIAKRLPTYSNIGEFAQDVQLIWSNAILYNAPTTVYFRAAEELRSRMEPILQAADQSILRLPRIRKALMVKVLNSLLPSPSNKTVTTTLTISSDLEAVQESPLASEEAPMIKAETYKSLRPLGAAQLKHEMAIWAKSSSSVPIFYPGRVVYPSKVSPPSAMPPSTVLRQRPDRTRHGVYVLVEWFLPSTPTPSPHRYRPLGRWEWVKAGAHTLLPVSMDFELDLGGITGLVKEKQLPKDQLGEMKRAHHRSISEITNTVRRNKSNRKR